MGNTTSQSGSTVKEDYDRGMYYYNKKDYPTALPYYKKIIDVYPKKYWWAHSSAAWTYYHLKNYRLALENFSIAIQLDSSRGQLSYLGRGWTYYFMKNYQKAIENFNASLRLDGGSVSSHDGLGWSYYLLDDYRRALGEFTEALSIDTTYTSSYNGRGWVYHRLGDYARAIENFNASLGLKPDSADAYNGRGWVHQVLDDFPHALTDFNEGIRLDPRSCYPYDGRGYVLYRLGKYSDAIKDFERSIRLKPNPITPKVYRNLGLAQLKAGEPVLALQNIEKSIELKPTYAYGYTARGEYYATLANGERDYSKKQAGYRKAEADYRAALRISLMGVKEREETEAGLEAVLKALETLATQTRSAASTSSTASKSAASARPVASPPTSPPSAMGFREISAGEIEYQGDAAGTPIKLGEGGFGEVLKGRYLGVAVAIKRLTVSRLTEADCALFREEVILHATIRHPNIVMLLAACLEQGHFALVMEYMAGGSLYGLIHGGTALPWERRVDMALKIVAGVVCLHAYSIVHRDLKSLNVLLENPYPMYGQVKLCDFGLAKIKSESSSTSRGAGVAGTPAWMPPEAFARGGTLTKKSDIYTLGMVLWELAALKRPYADAASVGVIAGWIASGQTEEIPGDTPPDFAQVIRDCWVQEPSARPEAKDLLPRLETLAATFLSAGAARASDPGVGGSIASADRSGPQYVGLSLGGHPDIGGSVASSDRSGPQYAGLSSLK